MTALRTILLTLIILLGATFAWFAFEWSRTETALAEKPFGVDFALVDQNGQPITQEAFRGKPTALYFGFTNCPEVCPTTLYELNAWLHTVDPNGDRINGYMVTVDPERDTPALLKEYISNASDRIIGISGDPDKVRAMARGFKIYFKKVPTDDSDPDGEYTMDHTASIFLLDGKGLFRGTIAYQEDPDIAKKKLENLIRG